MRDRDLRGGRIMRYAVGTALRSQGGKRSFSASAKFLAMALENGHSPLSFGSLDRRRDGWAQSGTLLRGPVAMNANCFARAQTQHQQFALWGHLDMINQH